MKNKIYFDLPIETLRILGGWAADCAERVLPLFEQACPVDPRPRAAIQGIRAFAAGGKRLASLRVLALDAYRAGLEIKGGEGLAAAAAAESASLAAAAAYTHPLADVAQTKHILGPAAYAALALEIQQNDPAVGESALRWAVERVPPQVCALLRKMPARTPGKTRIERILYDLDAALRNTE